MSDGWLYYFVSIVCLAVAILLFSLDVACSPASSAETDRPSKRVSPLVPLRRWVLILGCVLSVAGLAMFVTGISVDKDAELVNRDTYFALGGILLGVALILFFVAVSLTTYHQVVIQGGEEEEEGRGPTLDLLEPESRGPKIDILEPEKPTGPTLDLLEPESPRGPKLDLLVPDE